MLVTSGNSSTEFSASVFNDRTWSVPLFGTYTGLVVFLLTPSDDLSCPEWLACWTQAQKGLGSNHSRDAVM